jgi:hypothetical protein
MSNRLSCGSHHVDNLIELVMVYVGIINFGLFIIIVLQLLIRLVPYGKFII